MTKKNNTESDKPNWSTHGFKSVKMIDTHKHVQADETALEYVLSETLTGFWDWNILQDTVYLSPTFKEMLGYEDHEIKNETRSWTKLIVEEDIPVVWSNFDKHLSTRGDFPFDVTLKFSHKKGNIIFLRCKGKVVEWSDKGEAIRMLGTHTDVTELNDYKKIHRQTAETLELVMNGLEKSLWNWDYTSNKGWWSDSLYGLLGYKIQEIEPTFENMIEHLHPMDKQKFELAFDQHHRLREFFKVEARLSLASGGYHWFEIVGQSSWDDKGNPTTFAACLTDIELSKREEIENRQARMLMEEAGKMAQLGAWEVDIENRQPIWSPEVYRIHEMPMSYIPTLEDAVNFYHPDYREQMTARVQKAMSEGESWDMESKLITASGREIWVRAKGNPVMDENGKCIALRGAFQDIDDLKKKEIELQNSLNLVSEQNKRLLNFAYIVSHNLRSHTSNLNTMLRFLEQADNELDQKVYINHINDISNNLSETISYLNDVIKIQNDLKISKTELKFKDSLRAARNVLEGEILSKNVEIKTEFEVEVVQYVRAYLDSIFLNLLSNSIRYSSSSRSPKIVFRTYNEGGRTVLECEDNGLGIDLKKHGHKIFGMYKTFHKKAEARGIGLYLTKNQVEALGGSISVQSEVGRGSTFKIML